MSDISSEWVDAMNADIPNHGVIAETPRGGLVVGIVIWRENGPTFIMGEETVEWDATVAAAVLAGVMRDVARDDIDGDKFQAEVMRIIMGMVSGA